MVVAACAAWRALFWLSYGTLNGVRAATSEAKVGVCETNCRSCNKSFFGVVKRFVN